MNKTTQFWTLLRFQAVLSPVRALIAMPLAMSAPFFIPLLIGSSAHYRPALDIVLSNQNLFLVGFAGLMLLAPEVLRTDATRAQWPTGTEFLLTRAVDRPIAFRARTLLFYLLVLVLPLCFLPSALWNPTLQVNEYNNVAHQRILENVTGSIAANTNNPEDSHEITIPDGKILVESWRIWAILTLAIAAQVFLLAIYPFKYRIHIFVGAFVLLFAIPLVITLKLIPGIDLPSLNETIFFFFVAHQAMAWLVTIAALFLGQLWCEGRFASLEQ